MIENNSHPQSVSYHQAAADLNRKIQNSTFTYEDWKIDEGVFSFSLASDVRAMRQLIEQALKGTDINQTAEGQRIYVWLDACEHDFENVKAVITPDSVLSKELRYFRALHSLKGNILNAYIGFINLGRAVLDKNID